MELARVPVQRELIVRGVEAQGILRELRPPVHLDLPACRNDLLCVHELGGEGDCVCGVGLQGQELGDLRAVLPLEGKGVHAGLLGVSREVVGNLQRVFVSVCVRYKLREREGILRSGAIQYHGITVHSDGLGGQLQGYRTTVDARGALVLDSFVEESRIRAGEGRCLHVLRACLL